MKMHSGLKFQLVATLVIPKTIRSEYMSYRCTQFPIIRRWMSMIKINLDIGWSLLQCAMFQICSLNEMYLTIVKEATRYLFLFSFVSALWHIYERSLMSFWRTKKEFYAHKRCLWDNSQNCLNHMLIVYFVIW